MWPGLPWGRIVSCGGFSTRLYQVRRRSADYKSAAGYNLAPQQLLFCAFLLLASSFVLAADKQCACGSNPPPPPPNRELHPYALEPEDMRPFSNFVKPYHEWYTNLVEYNGAARDARTIPASEVDEVRIAFLGPIIDHKDMKLGTAMLHGAQMAVDEANARGGYAGKPFRLMVHNDGATWGASSNEVVKMTYDEHVWAMFGSISGDSTHIALRVSLRAELPIVNSAATDPTIPETIIPWYLTTIQDDRAQCQALARHIYTELGLKRMAILRINDRYGRFGVAKFRDASRRLGHPVIIEQKYMAGATDYRRQLRVIRDSRVEGIVLWADAPEAGMILKQMQELGMKQRVFGSFRTFGDEVAAYPGFEFVYPYDPNRDDPAWTNFQKRYDTRYGDRVNAFSALAFDTMNILMDAICRAGLNRGVIRDALYGLTEYQGITGDMRFDPNAKDIRPLYLGTVHEGGKVTFRKAAYATVGEGGVSYAGPALPNLGAAEVGIGVFGADADKAADAVQQDGFRLLPVVAGQSWGKASSEMVSLVYDHDVIGIIATDRRSAHLAEQIAVKSFIPVIAIADDRTLTSTNVPWIFRLPPGTSLDDAAHILLDAVHRGGLNRGKVRDLLASGSLLAGKFRFATTGEPR